MKPLSLACLAALACPVHPVHAADEPSLPAVTVTAPADMGRLGEPAATGSNLDLTRFETPASVDAISRAQLDARGDATLIDAITRAPGLSLMPHPGNSGSSLVSRGFSDTVSVMRLYDGMRQYGGVGLSFPFDTWSVERIEVLRGPASVIYGEGAVGGVVNVIPKKPTKGKIQNDIQLAVGTERTRRLAFGSGGAINDKLSYRFDASGNRSDGWVDRGDFSDRTLSGAIQLEVSRDFSLRLSTAYGRQKPMRYFGTPLVEGRQLEGLREKNYNVEDSRIAYKDSWTDLAATWTPNDSTVVRSRFYHIGSDRHWRNTESYTYNPATGLIDRGDNTEILHDQSQTGNTTDVAFKGSLFGLKNRVSAGFDINSSSFKRSDNAYSGSAPAVDPYDFEPSLYSSDFATVARTRSKAEQYSVFAENRLELTERWTVLAGLRHDRSSLRQRDLSAGTELYDKDFANTGWRLGTVLRATPKLALYGQYSEAADPISAAFFLRPASSGFKEATGRQLEIGIKQAFWNDDGEWTLAVYDIRKNNLLTRDPADPGRNIQVGERSARGIEGTISLALARGWQLDANASILRARFDEFSESSGGAAVSRAGNVPPDVPRRLANLWLSWDLMPDWTAGAGMRHVGARYADNANTLRLPSYTTTDLSLRWKMDRQTSLTLRGFNVFDKAYFTTAYYYPEQWLYGAGRRFELQLAHRF